MNIFDNIAANLSLKYENSEFYKNKLIKRYKPLITPGEKSQHEHIITQEKHIDQALPDKADILKPFLQRARRFMPAKNTTSLMSTYL